MLTCLYLSLIQLIIIYISYITLYKYVYYNNTSSLTHSHSIYIYIIIHKMLKNKKPKVNESNKCCYGRKLHGHIQYYVENIKKVNIQYCYSYYYCRIKNYSIFVNYMYSILIFCVSTFNESNI